MKIIAILTSLVLLLSGCALIEKANTTLDYVNDSTAYVNDIQDYGTQLPQLIEQAATSPQSAEQLVNKLGEMKDKALQFNELKVPALASDLHNTISGYNETLVSEIDGIVNRIEAKTMDFQSLLDSPLMQTIEKINQTLNLITALGQ